MFIILFVTHKLSISAIIFAGIDFLYSYSMLEYKSKWNDKTIIKIDRFFPSSKMCSNCGWINQDLTLKDREWTCPSCDETHDRDFNAAKNILKQGLKILSSGSGIESDVKQKQVEALSLDEFMKPETR